ncbi:MAG: DUF6285 domain-containing protein [Dongiaceae bacterium]
MTAERDDAVGLLEEARRTLLEILLPLLPADRRYDGLMVANAMAIAARQARLGEDLLRAEVQGLAALLDAPDVGEGPAATLRARLIALERRLVHDIRGGAYDDAGPRRDALWRHLRAVAEGRLLLSNPKALPP